MISFTDILALVGMVALRFGVPVLIVAGLGYLLKRLDARWEAEARAEQRTSRAAEQPAIRPTPSRPAVPSGTQIPTPPPMPFIVPAIMAKQAQQQAQQVQPGLLATPPTAARCWDVRGCTPDQKANCAAPGRPDVPCWQARFDAEGHIPEECVSCDIFQRYPKM